MDRTDYTKTGHKVPHNFLKELRNISTKFEVPLIFNETASRNYAYNDQGFYCSNDIVTPDAQMCYFGGQIGIVNLTKKYFLDKPLMLISTWDGDEFSTKIVTEQIERQSKKIIHTRKEFSKKIINLLNNFNCEEINIENGVGNFKGPLPESLKTIFHHRNNHYVVNPSFDSMASFLDQVF